MHWLKKKKGVTATSPEQSLIKMVQMSAQKIVKLWLKLIIFKDQLLDNNCYNYLFGFKRSVKKSDKSFIITLLIN